MQNILDKAYDKYALTSSAPSDAHTDLLCDPNLVEDYSDILKTMPKKLRLDEENTSVNGSVVINTASSQNWPEKDTKPVKPTVVSTPALQTEETEATQEPALAEPSNDTDYEYSDSEFEEDMENRLEDLRSSAKHGTGMAFFTQDNDSESEVHHRDFSDSSSEEDDLTTSFTSIKPYSESNNSDGEDDEIEEEFQALAPPEEIDPSKLYALYPFRGPDPSHCQLYQDQDCILLNDQDSYWWLVKRCNDGKIGFAPAEILETFPERLARLNCWKNENMSSQSVDSADLKTKTTTEQSAEDSTDHQLPYSKGNKSVSFNDVVSYAERFLQDSEREGSLADLEELDDTDKEESDRNKSTDTVGDIYEAALHVDDDDDDASEAVSDVSFNTGTTLPLHVKKVRNTGVDRKAEETADSKPHIFETQELDTHLSPFVGEKKEHKLLRAADDGLHQTFQAPIIPFAGHKEMPKSNSNYSISTIGEYSPSSSEWTNDSPQINNGIFEVDTVTAESIPSSRAIKDISQLVKSNENEEESQGPEEGAIQSEPVKCIPGDVQESKDSNHPEILEEPVSQESEAQPHAENHNNKDEKHSTTSCITPGPPGVYPLAQHISHRESISASSDDSCIDEGRGTSTTTINSTFSLNEAKHNHNHHPIVHELYNPLFGKIDDLLERLNSVINE
ncbi:LAME_0G19614g1_1 [Lachancea meyersii CBS 8951]|uniref:LAME_0G19614g1_1 n=1 Tax=Lachancea meyersii CBS 8951 TaxID=1266667 RepID=A0A1G4KC68_9SACH|nr:LAME_0G19614g1_1 [Lachancea meyersii CBS 8951]